MYVFAPDLVRIVVAYCLRTVNRIRAGRGLLTFGSNLSCAIEQDAQFCEGDQLRPVNESQESWALKCLLNRLPMFVRPVTLLCIA